MFLFFSVCIVQSELQQLENEKTKVKKLYTASVTSIGGRNGSVKSSDGVLDLQVRLPKELGGSGGAFTNPEQLFAAGYAACFNSALQHVAREQKIKITSTVKADVSIGPNDAGGFGLAVVLNVRVEGIDKEAIQKLVTTAHQVCPYSNATRNNIEVTLVVEDGVKTEQTNKTFSENS